ncbi:methenyltetrahydrofolate synthase domain-containing protein isoform X1 [Eublepharis macularius]|uniref:Methenyltetrahydrofolate synthase domain-containing protein n=1 Tax=Eublepharis macularius TaxID=481883 RepID=A0AA97LLI1_EUBMA|nr:methenyltetrahydrofolate synthase domain-containing protein isoform X1 [Eublepharis macularius]
MERAAEARRSPGSQGESREEAASRCQPPGVSKWDIRQKIWDYLEASNLADFPRPVHHRIPNFKGSFQMCHCIQKWEVFDKAREVKVDPDKPLEGIRLAALQARKTLLVPTPRLRTGLFNQIVPPPGAGKDTLRKCATSQGVRDYSVPIGLDANVHVDLVVVGSVAVSEKGWRIGKGEGFADMEYAMMVSMGAVREDTVVVTAVHDCQVVDIPEELLGDHDMTVDYIFTPTRVIQTGCKRPKPQGILWHKISYKTMEKIPILKSLRCREEKAGKDVTLKEERTDVPAVVKPASRARDARPESARLQNESSVCQRSPGDESRPASSDHLHEVSSLFVGNIPRGTRVSDFKAVLRERQATPVQLTWQGAQHRAFLRYSDKAASDAALAALQGLTLQSCALRVEPAKAQGSKMASGQ